MRELEYPYINSEIVRKNAKIKKQLLDSGNKLTEKNVAILCGSTVNTLKDALELFLLNCGIKPNFYISEYNKFYEEAVFPNEKLKNFSPDIIYIFTSFRNIDFDFNVFSNEEEIEIALNNEYQKYESIWKKLTENYNATVIQNNFEYPPYRILGNKDIVSKCGFSNFLQRLNNKFYDYANNNKNFYICDINYIAADFGLANWHDEKAYALYKLPCNIYAMVDIAKNVANIIKSIYGKNKKALALDLDNTLWGGVVSENGVNGIEIGPETAVGEMYLAFQKYLKKIKETGIILNVASKNDDDIAREGIEKSDGVLKIDDFVKIQANWNSKDRNIAEIADSISLGADSFVFVDDNPVERELVETSIKNIAVPQVQDVDSYIRILDRNGYFENTTISAEDKNKTDDYKANAKRAELKNEFVDYGEYLTSLQMEAEIKPFSEKYFERISQLTNKSNQFNLTTKRYSVIDITNFANDDTYITLYGKLKDKFGDNGLVAIFIGKIEDGHTLNIELLLMSCRVLMREMEFAIFDRVVDICKKQNIDTIKGSYLKTAKNAMVADLLDKFGFTLLKETEDGNKNYVLNINDYENKNKHIKISDNYE